MESIIADGVEKSMTVFNRRARGLQRRGRMRVYEELFIVKPDAPEEEVDGFIEQMKQVISTGQGNVDKVDNWGFASSPTRFEI